MPRTFLLPLLAGSLAFSVSLNSAAQSDVESPPAAQDSGPVEDLDVIMRQLEEIRGLKFIRDVPARVQPLDDFKAYVERDIDATFPPEIFNNMMDGLMRLGMVKERFDMGEEFTNALLSQAAAYYDPETGTFFYLMADMPLSALRTVAAHELVHALQDQHYDLKTFLSDLESEVGGDGPRNDDRVLALRALVEGEATYVQTLWQMADMNMAMDNNPAMEEMSLKMMANMDIDQLAQMAKQQMNALDEDDPMAKAIADMENIPSYILRPLYAAYMNGAYFTMKVRRSGEAWQELAATYKDLPASSEQVLHPDKYINADRDDPTVLTLPEFECLAESDWTPIDSAIHGEMYLNLLLREQGDARRAADAATQGWDGDIYQAWRNDAGDVMIALATTWDSEADALEFLKAWKRIVPRKYAESEVTAFDEDVARNVVWLAYSCGEEQGHGLAVRRGREVFVVEGASAELAEKMADEMMRCKIEHKQ
ncbi:MAG: hypothetical protein ACR2GY_07015 [Phycisphaerales bacterium]